MLRFTGHDTNKNRHKRAKELRHDASPYERKLWAALREASGPKKLRFRFQHPIPPYFADFVCMGARLIIELDGCSHDNSEGYDLRRDNFLRQQNFTIIRFTNDEIKENLDGVVRNIIEKAENLMENPNNGTASRPLP